MKIHGMSFLHYEFNAQEGDVIEVTIDHAANVQLLDPENFNEYKSGRTYSYYGGYVERADSPYSFNVPSDGNCRVTIDLGGDVGVVRASARLIPRELEVAIKE